MRNRHLAILIANVITESDVSDQDAVILLLRMTVSRLRDEIPLLPDNTTRTTMFDLTSYMLRTADLLERMTDEVKAQLSAVDRHIIELAKKCADRVFHTDHVNDYLISDVRHLAIALKEAGYRNLAQQCLWCRHHGYIKAISMIKQGDEVTLATLEASITTTN